MPLVSIVIPSHNHERYLGAAIDSILAQDYPRVELIVIDDGSTDNSRKVLENYTGRFHWEAQPNQGQVATLNRGWLMSRGDILGYLSADDLLYPGAIAAAVDCLTQHPDAVLSYCDFDLIDPYSSVIRRVQAPEVEYRRIVSEFICPPGPGAFFLRDGFEKAGLWDDSFQQMLDYEYWLRLGLHGRFVRIPRVLAAYRLHAGSQTFEASSRIRPEEPIRIIERYFEQEVVPEQVKALRAQSLGNAHLRAAQQYFRMGARLKGMQMLARAVRLRPLILIVWRTYRVLLNAIFNRIGHRLLWTVRRGMRGVKANGSKGGSA